MLSTHSATPLVTSYTHNATTHITSITHNAQASTQNASLTSNMILQTTWIHAVTASAVPDTVTALSVEFGNISLATCIDAPVLYKSQ